MGRKKKIKKEVMWQDKHDLNAEFVEDIITATGAVLQVTKIHYTVGFADRPTLEKAVEEVMDKYCEGVHSQTGVMIILNTIARDYLLVSREDLRNAQNKGGILDNPYVKRAIKDMDEKKSK